MNNFRPHRFYLELLFCRAKRAYLLLNFAISKSSLCWSLSKFPQMNSTLTNTILLGYHLRNNNGLEIFLKANWIQHRLARISWKTTLFAEIFQALITKFDTKNHFLQVKKDQILHRHINLLLRPAASPRWTECMWVRWLWPMAHAPRITQVWNMHFSKVSLWNIRKMKRTRFPASLF